MVKVVLFVGLGAVIAAASAGLISATSIGCNPVTDTQINAPLTECNPAYGGPLDESCMATIDVPDSDQCAAEASGSASTNARNLRRMEDASNSDVADLETYFGESLELDFTALKEQYSSGAAPNTPWPGSYWPTYQDSINVIWKSGEQSASEKYAEAYGLDPTDFMNKVSANNGIDSRSSSTACTADTDCTSLNDGSVCAKRKDASSGYCMPTWYGICHAWSPAALLEDEPKCDVVKNGQTFHVMDIKALITDVYDGSAITTIFTGARFNGPDTPVTMDSYGRYTSAARRDLGAGFFHIAITNILGKHNQSFIADVTAGSQVWNQPVRSYNVQTMELVDVEQASQQYFNTSTYPFNSEMVYLAYVKTTLSWVIEAYADGPLVSTQKVDAYTVSDDYEYLLELDANYAVIGGEWVEGSKTDHPDFLWIPTAKPDASTVTSIGLSYADVQELLELSVSCSASEATSASTSASASAGVSTSASASTSESASASASTSASAGASASATSASSSEMSSTTSSTAYSDTGTNEDASAGVVASSTTSGEGSNEARSASKDGSTAVGSTSVSGSTGTTDAAETFSSRSSTGSTIEVTAASLPSGMDALIVIPRTTTSNEESTAATDAPIDTGYYTAPPTTDGQDLADVIDTIDTTDSSGSHVQTSSSQQEAATTTTTTTQPSVHNSC